MKKKAMIGLSAAVLLILVLSVTAFGPGTGKKEVNDFGGEILEDAEPYRELQADGSYLEINYGGKYNEDGEYIIPAAEGYVVVTDEGLHNPVTGEYCYTTKDTTK